MSTDQLHSLQEPLRDELAEAIAKARSGKRAGAMAYELLRRDKRTHQLVGVVEQGEKVVFHQPPSWNIVAAPFDESGVDGTEKFEWERIEERTNAERFVRKKGKEFWTWVHPRYRWVFEVERSYGVPRFP